MREDIYVDLLRWNNHIQLKTGEKQVKNYQNRRV